MKIAMGSDHAGFELKGRIAEQLRAAGHEVADLGTHSKESVDYPDYAAAVGRSVAAGDAERGVLVCGTGIGVCMAANKVAGVRAALVHDRYTAVMSREHNDANVLCLGARVLDADEATAIAELWLTVEFGGDRHARRVEKINALDHAHT
jgi:ribose 5-phosphate isomerase B